MICDFSCRSLVGGHVLDNARRSLPALLDYSVPKEGRLTYCRNIKEAVADADWIQESVPERLEIKHKVFSEIQTHARKNALIGSSTSGPGSKTR